MKHPVSVFIMDVTNSTSEGNWNELTNYLIEWESDIRSWSSKEATIKVKHRMGDEILLIADHYATAYVIAFYMSLIWKLKKQKLYFGVACGHINDNLESIEIDSWNHPLIKRARMANEKIKNDTNRDTSIIFDMYEEVANFDKANQLVENMNLLAQLQDKMISDQAPQQKLVCSLYAVFGEQKRIAQELGKTTSTISSHFRKGASEMIFKVFNQLKDSLIFMESLNDKNKQQENLLITENLIKLIREYIQEDLNRFYPELIVKDE
ncbi:hypothetical protein CON78_29965 [Bacillus toyonensis]|uniref:hypothetical protein n=1 Tax=Bacillus toyonensis TaxID=155322 RepID=UPI000BED7628|nr:hypothetical protein [Bacillus toyonensis]MCG3795979.1 hypothetical protein [Bacillus toyonensis]PED94588.1 hypothetical protein CON78_29965 [Bacillus toyonensis]